VSDLYDSNHDVKISPSTAVVCVIVEAVMGYVSITKGGVTTKPPFIPMMIAIPLVVFHPLLKKGHWGYTCLYILTWGLVAYMFVNSDYQHFFNP
jgi:hypothetical protein